MFLAIQGREDQHEPRRSTVAARARGKHGRSPCTSPRLQRGVAVRSCSKFSAVTPVHVAEPFCAHLGSLYFVAIAAPYILHYAHPIVYYLPNSVNWLATDTPMSLSQSTVPPISSQSILELYNPVAALSMQLSTRDSRAEVSSIKRM